MTKPAATLKGNALGRDIDMTVTADGEIIDNAPGGSILAAPRSYEFDGRRFAVRWLTVATAASDDEERWMLYRSVNVELEPEGVRLTSTDATRFWTWWVDAGDDEDPQGEPDYTNPAEHSVTISDPEFRGRDLMRWVERRTRKDDDPSLTVELSIGRRPREEGQLLGMETPAATFTVYDAATGVLRESVSLSIMEGGFPDLRAVYLGAEPKPTDAIRFDPVRLAKMVKALPWATAAPGELRLSGETGLVVFDLGIPGLRGGLMPFRVSK